MKNELNSTNRDLYVTYKEVKMFSCKKIVCVLSLQKNLEGMKFSLGNKIT